MNDKDLKGPSVSGNDSGPHIGKERTGNAGGFFIALFLVIGTIIGGLMGQPSAGLLVGLGLGILTAIAIWLVDRNKGQK